ncbi:hypothetical protein SDC9_152037 [bioreactor metagenome]|uniref:Uncharacterized protein n=1 Tax=bioreactor metagenome TaxID=1076179 RepID=A0A645EUC4_9ZZZZ
MNYDGTNAVTLGNNWGSIYPAGVLIYAGCFGVEAPGGATGVAEAELQANNYYKCPSDTSNFGLNKTPQVVSYSYYVWKTAHSGWGSPAPVSRFIVGRDDPGAAIWSDIFVTTPNHPNDTANVLHLGGHVRGIPLNAKQKAYTSWGDRFRYVLDDITY